MHPTVHNDTEIWDLGKGWRDIALGYQEFCLFTYLLLLLETEMLLFSIKTQVWCVCPSLLLSVTSPYFCTACAKEMQSLLL